MTTEIDNNSERTMDALRDDELDTVIGGLTASRVIPVYFHVIHPSASTIDPFSPILLPPSPC